MLWSRSQVRRDIDRWHDKGWLTADARKAILRDIDERRSGFSLPGVLGVLGAVLVGFAAMSFVAANWAGMPKLLRLSLLVGGLWLSYGLAAVLLRRGLDVFAQAAVLAGVTLFGASIMLVAQMYHIEGHPPGAVLMWGVGALVAAVAFRSVPAFVAATAILLVWSWWEMSLAYRQVHWAYLPAWAATALGYAWLRWRPGLHVGALSLAQWIVSLGYIVGGPHAHWIVVAIGVVIAGTGYVLHEPIDRVRRISHTMVTYGAGLAYAGLFALQFMRSTRHGSVDMLIVLAVLTLGLIVALIFEGLRKGDRSLLWIGYAGFAAEVLALYFKTVGTLLGSSLFFLTAGLIVSGLAWVAYRLHQRTASRAEGSI